MINKFNLYYRIFIILFWVVFCRGFVYTEIPALNIVNTPVALLVDCAFILLGLCTLRSAKDIWVIISFLMLGFASTVLVNHMSMVEFINGSRDFIGILFLPPLFRYFFLHDRNGEFREAMNKHLFLLLVLQAPCLVFQFLKYGANDAGGGTLGYGGSGIISMAIYIISFYLIRNKWDSSNYLGSLKKNWIYIALLFPTFLNETKASFIFFALYFVLLMKPDRKMIIKLLMVSPVGILALILVGKIYLNATGFESKEVFSFDILSEYLLTDDLDSQIELGQMVQDGIFDMDPEDAWNVDIPRFSKLLLAPGILEDDSRGGLWFGAGLGQFKGYKSDNIPKFAQKYQYLLRGTQTWLFTLFVQLGILGIIWFIATTIWELYAREGNFPMATQTRILVSSVLLMILVYGDHLRYLSTCTVIYYVMMSLQAMRQEHNVVPVHPVSQAV